MINHAGTKSI